MTGRIHRVAVMGTVLSIQIVGSEDSRRERRDIDHGIERAVNWFQRVEADCSRFDPSSELRRLCATVNRPVRSSALLFRAIEFAIAVATETDGAFDPTVGSVMEAKGFDAHHRSGDVNVSGVGQGASFRDVDLDADARTVTLERPLLLDLGAVAKGLAVDLAAQELREFGNFAIDAGGDLYLGGCNHEGAPWSVGIRHPRIPSETIETVQVSDVAVCTSGDYERVSAAGEHHLVDPRSGDSVSVCASATVIGSSAMVADALATTAFVLGPAEGLALLERHGLKGMIITPSLQVTRTQNWAA